MLDHIEHLGTLANQDALVQGAAGMPNGAYEHIIPPTMPLVKGARSSLAHTTFVDVGSVDHPNVPLPSTNADIPPEEINNAENVTNGGKSRTGTIVGLAAAALAGGALGAATAVAHGAEQLIENPEVIADHIGDAAKDGAALAGHALEKGAGHLAAGASHLYGNREEIARETAVAAKTAAVRAHHMAEKVEAKLDDAAAHAQADALRSVASFKKTVKRGVNELAQIKESLEDALPKVRDEVKSVTQQMAKKGMEVGGIAAIVAKDAGDIVEKAAANGVDLVQKVDLKAALDTSAHLAANGVGMVENGARLAANGIENVADKTKDAASAMEEAAAATVGAVSALGSAGAAALHDAASGLEKGAHGLADSLASLSWADVPALGAGIGGIAAGLAAAGLAYNSLTHPAGLLEGSNEHQRAVMAQHDMYHASLGPDEAQSDYLMNFKFANNWRSGAFPHITGEWNYKGTSADGYAVYSKHPTVHGNDPNPMYIRYRDFSQAAHGASGGPMAQVSGGAQNDELGAGHGKREDSRVAWQMVALTRAPAPPVNVPTDWCANAVASSGDKEHACQRAGCMWDTINFICKEKVLQPDTATQFGPGRCGNTWCGADEYCSIDRQQGVAGGGLPANAKCYRLIVPDNRAMLGKPENPLNSVPAEDLGTCDAAYPCIPGLQCDATTRKCERIPCTQNVPGMECVSTKSSNGAGGRLFPARELLQSFPHKKALEDDVMLTSLMRWSAPTCVDIHHEKMCDGSFPCHWSSGKCSTDCKMFTGNCELYGCGPVNEGHCTPPKELKMIIIKPPPTPRQDPFEAYLRHNNQEWLCPASNGCGAGCPGPCKRDYLAEGDPLMAPIIPELKQQAKKYLETLDKITSERPRKVIARHRNESVISPKDLYKLTSGGIGNIRNTKFF